MAQYYNKKGYRNKVIIRPSLLQLEIHSVREDLLTILSIL